MPKKQYLERLSSYLKYSGPGPDGHTPFEVLGTLRLGVSLTVVYDSLGEYDIFFDTDDWEPAMPEIWGNSHYPQTLEPYGLGVLMGYWQATNPVRSFEMAEAFAKRFLKPKHGGSWYNPLPAVQFGADVFAWCG